jgi:hypothetical protein
MGTLGAALGNPAPFRGAAARPDPSEIQRRTWRGLRGIAGCAPACTAMRRGGRDVVPSGQRFRAVCMKARIAISRLRTL